MAISYKTTAQVVSSGKRVGFLIEETDNLGKVTTSVMLDSDIKSKMNSWEIFDLTLTNRGFEFKDKHRKVTELPKINIPTTIHNKVKQKKTANKSKTSTKHGDIVLKEYTGKELLQHIESLGIQELKKRDFVNGIVEYCKCDLDRVLAISGLRGTGKTTGVLQAILELNDYNNTVYIEIDKTSDIDCLQLRNYLVERYLNKRYIFIDEITRVKDLINNSGFLADMFCTKNKKVIISGTDSLALIRAEGSGLYHRMICMNITHISYKDAKRTMNIKLNDYIKSGGLYEKDKIVNLTKLKTYIDAAVLTNIYNTLNKNKGAVGLLNLEGITDKKVLKTLIFRILYAIVYTNMKRSKPRKKPTETNVNYIIDMFNIKKSPIYDINILNQFICDKLDIERYIQCTESEIKSVLNAMEEIGLLVRIENIFDPLEVSYYITNPSIANQIMLSIIKLLDTRLLERKQDKDLRGKWGILFESIIATHTKLLADRLGYNVYFYHDTNHREIDLIIEKETMDEFEDIYLYYEVKLTSNSDIAVVKSRWLNDSNININGTVVEKGIIYTGNNKTFTGFEDPNMQAPSKMTLQQVENLNMGTKLISAEDYLLHTEEKLSVLDK